MAGGATSPPICRAAWRIDVPGSTSMVMLSIVTLKSFFSSPIYLLFRSAAAGAASAFNIFISYRCIWLNFRRSVQRCFFLDAEDAKKRRGRGGLFFTSQTLRLISPNPLLILSNIRLRCFFGTQRSQRSAEDAEVCFLLFANFSSRRVKVCLQLSGYLLLKELH